MDTATPAASPPAGDQPGYRGLVDEYTVARNAESSLYATPDIVSPSELTGATPTRDDDLSRLVTLLSTSSGCLQWIRRELSRCEDHFTTADSLRIFSTTWNVNGKKPLVKLDPWLLSEPNRARPPDVYVVGFQEVQPLSGISVVSTDDTRGSAWRRAVETCVAKIGDYVTIGARQMVGVYLIVLVARAHYPFVQNVSLTDAGTGILRAGGNKGAVACRFVLYDRTVCCLSSHLAAHDYNFERRNQDYHDIVRKAVFFVQNPDVSPFSYREPEVAENELKRLGSRYDSITEPTSVINLLDHDLVIWAGDLNYRFDELPVEQVTEHIANANWPALTQFDQLSTAMKSGMAFQGFDEMNLDFAPTYKLDLYEDSYAKYEEENALKRTPAWTDRVLWQDRTSTQLRKNSVQNGENAENGGSVENGENGSSSSPKEAQESALRPSAYMRHELFSSDHRPVSVSFDMDVTVIDVMSRNKAVENIHRNLRKRQNLLRPRLSISSTAIDLGPVEFEKPVMGPVPLILHNMGHVTISINIDDYDLPSWLHAADASGSLEFTLAPLEEKQVHFRAHVRPGSGLSTRLNMGMEKLVACVPLSIQGKSEAFISVLGDYQRTCFGNSVSHLAAHPQPFRSVPPKEGDDARRVFPSRALTIPKEIHFLVSFLMRGCTQSVKPDSLPESATESFDMPPEKKALSSPTPANGAQTDTCALHTNEYLFLQVSDHGQIEAVRRYIDEGTAIPDDTPVAAVASCLLALLDSQEDSVVPHSCYDGILDLSRRGDFVLDDVRQILDRQNARAPVFNTLVYLFAMLNELPGAKRGLVKVKGSDGQSGFEFVRKGSDAEYLNDLMSMFAKVVVRQACSKLLVGGIDAEEDWNERISFMEGMLMLCRESVLEATFDYSTGLERV